MQYFFHHKNGNEKYIKKNLRTYVDGCLCVKINDIYNLSQSNSHSVLIDVYRLYMAV